MGTFGFNQVTAQLVETVVNRLRSQIGIFETILRDRKLLKDDDKFGDIYRGTRVRISEFPAIRVIYTGVESSDFATRYLQEQHNFFIDCMVKLAVTHDKVAPEESVLVLGRSVQAYLCNYNNRQFEITGDRKKVDLHASDSFASSVELGYSESGNLRIARVSYWVKTHVPFMV